MTLNRFSNYHARNGLTLVEVVAGLALLATLLVTILLAFGAHAGQIRQAERRLEAIAVADELLREWSAAGGIPEVGSHERLAEYDDLSWQIVSSPIPPAVGNIFSQVSQISQVRLEIVRQTGTHETEVLTDVDLFVASNNIARVNP